MTTNKQNWHQTGKLIAVNVGVSFDNKDVFFLFTANQVEDVLGSIVIRGVPFAPQFLLGICSWRGQVLPVVDLDKKYGIQQKTTDSKGRYFVVRTGTPLEEKSDIIRGVIRVSDQVRTIDIPSNSVVSPSGEIDFQKELIRGTYHTDDHIYIFPELLTILQDNQSIDFF